MKTITISDEKYELIKEQLEDTAVCVEALEDFIGKKVFIRTVTFYVVGKVEKIVGNLMFLSGASWVADTGRFMNAIKEGTLEEVEPVGDWFVNINSIVDGGFWKHDLPAKQK